jgi:hypothetical protein
MHRLAKQFEKMFLRILVRCTMDYLPCRIIHIIYAFNPSIQVDIQGLSLKL